VFPKENMNIYFILHEKYYLDEISVWSTCFKIYPVYKWSSHSLWNCCCWMLYSL